MRDRQLRLGAEGRALPAPKGSVPAGCCLGAGLGEARKPDAGRGGKQSKRSATSNAARRVKGPVALVGYIALHHGVPTAGHWNKRSARRPA